MTVRELIVELKIMPQDARVVVVDLHSSVTPRVVFVEETGFVILEPDND